MNINRAHLSLLLSSLIVVSLVSVRDAGQAPEDASSNPPLLIKESSVFYQHSSPDWNVRFASPPVVEGTGRHHDNHLFSVEDSEGFKVKGESYAATIEELWDELAELDRIHPMIYAYRQEWIELNGIRCFLRSISHERSPDDTDVYLDEEVYILKDSVLFTVGCHISGDTRPALEARAQDFRETFRFGRTAQSARLGQPESN